MQILHGVYVQKEITSAKHGSSRDGPLWAFNIHSRTEVRSLVLL